MLVEQALRKIPRTDSSSSKIPPVQLPNCFPCTYWASEENEDPYFIKRRSYRVDEMDNYSFNCPILGAFIPCSIIGLKS
jgi:hypothetical protein